MAFLISSNNYIYTAAVFCLTYLILNFANGACPKGKDNLTRLNNTRFYVAQGVGNIKDLTDWNGAFKKCQSHGMKLATIDSFGEDAVVGRALEITIGKNLPIGAEKWSKYWIDAYYDNALESYVTQAKKKLRYFNILYTGKVIGYGNDISADGNVFKPTVRGPKMCLTYGITFIQPGKPDESYLGFETRMQEHPCYVTSSRTKRFALCEADKASCSNGDDNNYLEMTDARNYYVEQGNLLFGNPRRFIVNLEPRTKAEAKKYCTDRGMYLYRPSSKDGCFIPYFALWNRRITTGLFWTDVKSAIGYNNYFIWPNGERVDNNRPYANVSTTRRNVVFSCVATAYSYEAKGKNNCGCQWNSMVIVPANCGLNLGTICQHVEVHTNTTLGTCGVVWGHGEDVYDLLDNYNGRQYVVNRTHTIPFASRNPNAKFYRSTYKQIFGPRLCPNGYKLATTKSIIPEPNPSGPYFYDAEEDYWIEEYRRGFHLKGKLCTLSTFDKSRNRRTIKTGVDCHEWHFYLCERSTVK